MAKAVEGALQVRCICLAVVGWLSHCEILGYGDRVFGGEGGLGMVKRWSCLMVVEKFGAC